MKRTTIFLSLLLAFLFISIQSNATHIVGGEMNYLFLGNGNYQITLTVYRDCINGQAPFDDPAAIGIFDIDGNLISNTSAFISSERPVPNVINSPCLNPPTNICYEVAQYVFTVNLPPLAGGYTITYQRCCRNFSIMNIANVQNTGATYTASIPDPGLAAANNNPIFNSWPPTFICKDVPFTFDHSATDPDGDSLVYVISYPYEGGDQVNRAPNPPDPPAYNPVTYITPYSINNVFGGTPLVIHPVTGILKATPDEEGQYVYGVTVEEYRNGVKISETRRDFQVNVVPCPGIAVASIFSPTITCGSLDANFVNTSANAATYSWDFGDPSTVNDTSSTKNPVYAYPDTGDYIATLVAYSSWSPLCNDTATGLVHVYPIFLTDYYLSNQHCSNTFSFADLSYGIGGVSNYWVWNFGDDSTSSIPNPVHEYSSPGTYEVRLITSTDSACEDTMVKTIHVLQIPVSNFSFALDTCTYTITTKDSSEFSVSYRWDFGDLKNSFFREGNHQYFSPGEYDIGLIVSSDSTCVDTSYRHISIPPLPEAAFSYATTPCDSNVQFKSLSANASEFFWDFGDDQSDNIEAPTHTYSISGIVPVKLTATSQYGCVDVLDSNIFFVSFKVANFEPVVDSCKALVNFNDVTYRAAAYYWDFGDGTTSVEAVPVHTYQKDGEHIVTLTINKESVCPDSTFRTVNYESPLGEKVFVPNSFTPNGDGHNDFFELSIFRPCEIYKLTIYNRWGQKILESDDASSVRWDGTYKGEMIPDDVYVYILEGSDNRQQGIINLLK